MRRAPRLTVVLFLGPALLGLIVFRLHPIALTLWESFFLSSFSGGFQKEFAGLSNYVSLFQDPIFWQSLWVTLKFNLIVNPIQIALALGLAVMAAANIKGIKVYRLLFFIPVGVSLPIAAVIWDIMFTPNSGFINSVLASFGLPQQRFLGSPDQALNVIIWIASWKGVSYWMLFLLAGINTIPRNLYEAAMIDGAGGFTRFFRITLPLLRRILLFVLVADISVNFLLFAPVFMLTQGGPAGTTNVLMYEAYKTGFVYGDMGRAMAMVLILVLLVLLVVTSQFYLLRQRE